ncbi:MAG: MBL fold metallo-hydrolase [Ignavibacteria bacterium]|nr:MBL fold metallo-hydrolase [Ignavibacteria bacterium]MBT8381290.1 MBL fold metallo-hydrolase [Ignavibacteria bacterium]MBT8392632.1 MBL fold metallo-hydrolase [Ignavibacteria bacterium]NNJ51983.1 Zn-dependent hydrolase [Ignavibacteriaceae bacterium]NNL20140.1 Zn-dependent hydrolase [Ignavibacteriaceae bacterium]
MDRRRFIKNSSLAALGSMIIPQKFARGMRKPSVENMIKPVATPDVVGWKDDEINIAWIGHATVLINFYGKYILTDPVFFEAVGVYFEGFILGPKRASLPALMLDEIPKPDIVLVSHAHMDHMDFKTLKTLTEKFPDELDCIVAYNTKDVIEELQWKSLQEIDWDERITLNGINFKGIEVKHFGWRYPGEKDRRGGHFEDGRSYNGFILERKGKKILFGGDTTFSNKFKKHRNENVDIAIMPIGAYKPWRKYHCTPEEALVMAEYHLGAKYFIPIHCKTFDSGDMIYEPLRWMNKSSKHYKIKIGLRDIGETFTLKA